MSALAALTAGATLAVALVIYFESGFVSIPGGDSGELAAEACAGGVAHPPGYPLFILLGHAALRLWKGALPPILVLNRLCAALGAISAAFQSASVLSLAKILLPGANASAVSSAAIASVAVGIGLTTAFAPLLWLYNTQTEVFALNNAFVALLLWILVSAVRSATVEGASTTAAQGALHRWLCVGALASGLSLCNQHTSILLIAPVMIYCLALWLWLFRGKLPSLPRAVSYAALLFAGLLPYAWMPISHGFFRNPGSWGDTTSVRGFIRHFLRQDYGTFRLISKDASGDGKRAVEGPVERHLAYIHEIKDKQLTQVALALAVVGIVGAVLLAASAVVSIARKQAAATVASSAEASKGSPKASANSPKSPVAASPKQEAGADEATAFASRAAFARSIFPFVLVALLVFYFVVFHGLSNMSLSEPLLYGVHARFWMQPTYLLTLLSGVGAILLAQLVGRIGGAKTEGAASSKAGATGSSSSSFLRHAVMLALGAALSSSSLRHMHSNYHALDNSGNDAMARYGLAMLEPLPPNATLVTGFDMQWTSVRYLQQCEGVRRDVTLLNAPVMSFNWFESHRRLHPHLSFPGTHLVSHLSAAHAAGGFSLADFFVANIAADKGASLVASYDAVKPHPQFIEKRPARLAAPSATPPKSATAASNLFYSGVFVFSDQDDHALQFELRPFGIVSHVVPAYQGAHTRLNHWRNITKSVAKDGLDYNTGGPKGRANPVLPRDVAAARKAWQVVESVAAPAIHPTPSLTRSLAALVPALDQPLASLSALLPHHTEFVGAIRGSGVVNFTRYDETTWELATRIDTWNQGVAYATWLLEWALQDPKDDPAAAANSNNNNGGDYVNPGPAMEALRILEQALVLQAEHNSTVAASTYKNIGLACMRLVRGRSPAVPDTRDEQGNLNWPMLPVFKEAGLSKIDISEQLFRNAASQRVLDTWTIYLRSPESKTDPGASSIRNVVQVLRDVSEKQQRQLQQQQQAQQAAQQPRKPKA